MSTLKTILIVEDNEDNSILTEKILNYYGYQTVIARHGKATLEYCQNHQPDLILMDLSLPDIDGIELTRLIKLNPQFKQIPIIAVSAHASSEIQEISEEAGLNDFITKPFLPEQLIHIIRKHLD